MPELNIVLPEDVAFVISGLEAAGFEAYAVGGCVRDSLLGRVPGDWDLCTSARPEAVIEAFPGARFETPGLRHGTVTLIRNRKAYEITAYRTEGPYSDGRHPDSVTFIGTLADDLKRRDFTINAMAYHPQRGVVDLFGGQADLRDHVIRCVGDADERFAEDALRILRALRFAARLGFAIEPTTAAAMEENAPRLSGTSPERILGELRSFLKGPDWRPLAERFSPVLRTAAEFLPPFRTRRELAHLYQELGETAFAYLMELVPSEPGVVKAFSASRAAAAERRAVRALALTAKDLTALGIPAGPELGALQRRLAGAVAEGLPNTRETLLEAVKTWIDIKSQ